MNKDLQRAQNLLNVGLDQSSIAYSLLAIAKHLTKEQERVETFPPAFYHKDVCTDPTCNTGHRCDNTCDPVCNKVKWPEVGMV